MEGIPVLTTAVGLVALVWKLMDLVKLATNLPATGRRFVTLAGAMALGVAVLFLYGASQLGGFDFGTGVAIVDMNWATKTIAGLAVGSAAAASVDLKKSIDNTDTAGHPGLRMPTGSPPAPPSES